MDDLRELHKRTVSLLAAKAANYALPESISFFPFFFFILREKFCGDSFRGECASGFTAAICISFSMFALIPSKAASGGILKIRLPLHLLSFASNLSFFYFHSLPFT